MTLIVGIEHKGGALLAADSLISGSNYVDTLAAPKLDRVGEYAIGSSGAALIADIVAHHLCLESPPLAPKLLLGHIVRSVVPALRAAFRAHSVDKTEKGTEFAGGLLIATRGLVFEVCCDYQVSRSQHGYAVVGSGSMVALGALVASEGRPPKERAVAALTAAERHTNGVRRPWRFMSA